jgi:hypothetical protein
MLDVERVLYEIRSEYFVQLVGRECSNGCYLEVERYFLPTSRRSEPGTQLGRKGMLVVDVLIFRSLFDEITSTVLDYTASDEVET